MRGIPGGLQCSVGSSFTWFALSACTFAMNWGLYSGFASGAGRGAFAAGRAPTAPSTKLPFTCCTKPPK